MPALVLPAPIGTGNHAVPGVQIIVPFAWTVPLFDSLRRAGAVHVSEGELDDARVALGGACLPAEDVDAACGAGWMNATMRRADSSIALRPGGKSMLSRRDWCEGSASARSAGFDADVVALAGVGAGAVGNSSGQPAVSASTESLPMLVRGLFRQDFFVSPATGTADDEADDAMDAGDEVYDEGCGGVGGADAVAGASASDDSSTNDFTFRSVTDPVVLEWRSRQAESDAPWPCRVPVMQCRLQFPSGGVVPSGSLLLAGVEARHGGSSQKWVPLKGGSRQSGSVEQAEEPQQICPGPRADLVALAVSRGLCPIGWVVRSSMARHLGKAVGTGVVDALSFRAILGRQRIDAYAGQEIRVWVLDPASLGARPAALRVRV